jgi:hypothetical protein
MGYRKGGPSEGPTIAKRLQALILKLYLEMGDGRSDVSRLRESIEAEIGISKKVRRRSKEAEINKE